MNTVGLWTLYLGIRHEEYLRESTELRAGALLSPAALQRAPAADMASTARMEQTILPNSDANAMVAFTWRTHQNNHVE